LVGLLIVVAVLWLQPRELKDLQSSLQKTITQTVGTTTWNTFRSDTHGFELRYPNDWEVIEDPTEEGMVFAAAPKEPKEKFREVPLPIFGVLVQTPEENENFIANYVKDNSTKITVGGVEGTKFSHVLGGIRQTLIEVRKDNLSYNFQFYSKDEQSEQIFELILATFEFLKK
jgi:hypothetical protein